MNFTGSDHKPRPRFFSWTAEDYIYIAAETVVGILAVVTNGLVLLAMMRYRRLRTVTNCYIGSLSVADMLVGLLVPPLLAVSKAGLPRNFYACVLINSLVLVCVNISILSLFCVALDRYWAVVHPIARRKVATKGRALLIAAAMWVLGIFLGLIPLMGWHKSPEGFSLCSYSRVIDRKYSVYLIFIGFLVPILLAMLYMHVRIILAFRSMCESTQMSSIDMAPKRRRPITAREMKMFKTLSLMFGLFALCWLPLYILNCIRVWFDVDIYDEVTLSAVILTHSNSFIDPVLYAVNQPGFRRVLRKYVPRFFTDVTEATETEFQSVTMASAMYFETSHEGHVEMEGQADQTRTEAITPHLDSKSLHPNSMARGTIEETGIEDDMPCTQILSAEKVNPTVMTESPLSSEDIKPMIAISGKDSSKGMEIKWKLSGSSTNTENKSATLINKNSKEMGSTNTKNMRSDSYENLGLIALACKSPSSTEQTEQIANGEIALFSINPSSTEQTEQIANGKTDLLSKSPSSTEQTEQIANGKIALMSKNPSSTEQTEQIADGKIALMSKSQSSTEQTKQITDGKIAIASKELSPTEQTEQIASGKDSAVRHSTD